MKRLLGFSLFVMAVSAVIIAITKDTVHAIVLVGLCFLYIYRDEYAKEYESIILFAITSIVLIPSNIAISCRIINLLADIFNSPFEKLFGRVLTFMIVYSFEEIAILAFGRALYPLQKNDYEYYEKYHREGGIYE